MSEKVVPFASAELAVRRQWLHTSDDPEVLRNVGLSIADDFEEALILIDELSCGDAPGQMYLWDVADGDETIEEDQPHYGA